MGEQVPVTEIVIYYQGLRKESEADRIAEAQRHLKDPAELAGMFARSVEGFSSYCHPELDFYGDPEERAAQPFAQKSKTRVLAAGLVTIGGDELAVEPEPRLSFRYIDRELTPARTPGATFDGRSTRFAPKLDLLLSNASDRTPIVAEAKVDDDMDPFFALVQALMMASQLATPNQLERLRRVYPGSFDEDAARVDVYLVIAGAATGTNWPELSNLASDLAEALMTCDAITKSVRRIAAVMLELTARPVFDY